MSAAPALSLEQAIDRLYETFAPYTAQGMSGCPHCVDEAESRRLVSTPLKELTPRDLLHYAFSALYTWGGIDDFKHFLPRVFELVARDELDIAEALLGKPGYGKWRDWPENEQVPVEQFYRALWFDVLARYPHPLEADPCLCGIARSVDDLRVYLDTWSAADDRPAVTHLGEFINWNAPGVDKKGRGPHLTNPFWKERPQQVQQVADWLLEPARREQVERAFIRFGDDVELTALLEEALYHLDVMRGTMPAARPKPHRHA